VPVPIALKPPSAIGVSNALIEFGYQENGTISSFYCTSRQDPCYANAATVPLPPTAPFLFGSETPSGLSCSSGCTIAIPGISQRVMFYRVVYRTSGNAVISTSPITAIVVP
jgi:hypothetical protein